MFGIGFFELTLIMFIALIFLGPKRLPEIARALGKAFHEFQNAFSEVRETIQSDIVDIDATDEGSPNKENDKKDTG